MSDRELVNVPSSVRIVEADVSTDYWRVVKLECWDDERSQGSRYIYGHNDGPQESVYMIVRDDEDLQLVSVGGAIYYGAVSSGKTYSAEIDSAPSERIEGMEVSEDGICSYSVWWELVGGDSLSESLRAFGRENQVIEVNRDAALLKAMLKEGFIPTSAETLLDHEGDSYSAQSAQRVKDGTVRVYYVKAGDWDNVQSVE
ncbi:MAG: hypothetical protein ACPGWR_09680 [Ardenticatenaceae bacterium]